MNQKTSETPIELKIDVEQWRSDIRTFAEATKQDLDDILARLSNRCSNSFDEVPISRQGDDDRGIPSAQFTASTSFTNNEQCGDDRLAKLKSRLAQRISKSN